MIDNLPPELAAKIDEVTRVIEGLKHDREEHVEAAGKAHYDIVSWTRVRDAYVEAAAICRTVWYDASEFLASDFLASDVCKREGCTRLDPDIGREVAEAQAEQERQIVRAISTDPKKRRSPTETREAVLDVFKREPISVWSVEKLIAELQIPAAAIENAVGYLERSVKISLVRDGWWRLRVAQPTEAPIATGRVATFVSAHEPPKGETEEQRFARIEDFIMRCGDSGANPDQLRTIHATPGDLNYLITKGVVKAQDNGRYRYVPQPPITQFDPLADLNAAAADC